jgi:hypothetical protein
MKFRTKVIWLNPSRCLPPHKITHPEKFETLYFEFKENGWSKNEPPLLGYQMKKIQLISGSHRHAAAKCAKINLPVIIYPYKMIEKMWGTDEWLQLLEVVSNMKLK